MTEIHCFVGGQWQENWPADDRATQYGDGLFETMRLQRGDAPMWRWHEARLQQGLDALAFPPDSMMQIHEAMGELSDRLDLRSFSAAKLLVSRGSGPRGYGLPAAPDINLQFQLFEAPAWRWSEPSCGISVGISDVTLGSQPLLAGIKHLNRLEQVLARARFADHWQEAVMLDQQQRLIEGCYSNLYLCVDGQWLTPALTDCGVNGVVRRWLLEQGAVAERILTMAELETASAMAMSNSLTGLVPVARCGDVIFDPYHAHLSTMKHWQQQLERLF